MNMKKTNVLGIVIAMMMSLIVTACGGKNSGNTDPAPAEQPTTTAETKANEDTDDIPSEEEILNGIEVFFSGVDYDELKISSEYTSDNAFIKNDVHYSLCDKEDNEILSYSATQLVNSINNKDEKVYTRIANGDTLVLKANYEANGETKEISKDITVEGLLKFVNPAEDKEGKETAIKYLSEKVISDIGLKLSEDDITVNRSEILEFDTNRSDRDTWKIKSYDIKPVKSYYVDLSSKSFIGSLECEFRNCFMVIYKVDTELELKNKNTSDYNEGDVYNTSFYITEYTLRMAETGNSDKPYDISVDTAVGEIYSIDTSIDDIFNTWIENHKSGFKVMKISNDGDKHSIEYLPTYEDGTPITLDIVDDYTENQ